MSQHLARAKTVRAFSSQVDVATTPAGTNTSCRKESFGNCALPNMLSCCSTQQMPRLLREGLIRA